MLPLMQKKARLQTVIGLLGGYLGLVIVLPDISLLQLWGGRIHAQIAVAIPAAFTATFFALLVRAAAARAKHYRNQNSAERKTQNLFHNTGI